MSDLYDLTLLLDSKTPEEQRAKILADTEASISAGGAIVTNQDWGLRRLSYEIDHRVDATYHLLQFNGPSELLDALDHNLKITDGVVRFRIIKVLPGTPSAVEPRRETRPPAEAAS